MIKTIRAGIGLIKVSICIPSQWQSLNGDSNWHFDKAYPSAHKTSRHLIKIITAGIGFIKVSIGIPIQWQSLNGDSNLHFNQAYSSANITNKCLMTNTKVSITMCPLIIQDFMMQLHIISTKPSIRRIFLLKMIIGMILILSSLQ